MHCQSFGTPRPPTTFTGSFHLARARVSLFSGAFCVGRFTTTYPLGTRPILNRVIDFSRFILVNYGLLPFPLLLSAFLGIMLSHPYTCFVFFPITIFTSSVILPRLAPPSVVPPCFPLVFC